MGTTEAPSAGSVAAAIVTLDPEIAVVAHVEALLSQVSLVVVVDNGSGDAAGPVLDAIAALSGATPVRVIRNAANLGIATALNQAAEAAIEAGAAWLLTLDQDAAPSPEIVAVAAESFGACPFRDRLAVIGSTSSGDVLPARADHSGHQSWFETPAAITAGSFVSLAAFRELGPFRDDFFVDYVDIEYCLRARARGYRVIRSVVPAMEHRVGRPTGRRLGWRSVHPTNHPAIRRYYITRNRILVWRRYARKEARFVARDLLASQKELVKLTLFESDRRAKIGAVLSGAVDGLRGVTGEKGKPRR